MKKDTTEEMLDKYSLVKKTLTDKGYTLVSANSVNSFITSRIEYWYINIIELVLLEVLRDGSVVIYQQKNLDNL
jgi:hypothetical protein